MKENPQLQATSILAVIIHGVLILGISFAPAKPLAPTASLEVTLASFKSDTAAEEADFLAQNNQLGSGSLDEAALLSTNELADFQSDEVNVITPPKPQTSEQRKAFFQKVITTTGKSQQNSRPSLEQVQNEQSPQLTESEWWTIAKRNQEIASLEAQLREKQQLHAKRPRIRQATAVATRQSSDAAYLDAWRTKIEIIANQNYPTLDIQNLWGELRLMVAVNKNGTIHRIKLLESSGHPKLDAAALKIVRMAAPFDPFPPEMSQNTDILQIIRTWRNERGQYVSGS